MREPLLEPDVECGRVEKASDQRENGSPSPINNLPLLNQLLTAQIRAKEHDRRSCYLGCVGAGLEELGIGP